ncbi:BPI fold-containing family A member 2 [Thomomys bottae]
MIGLVSDLKMFQLWKLVLLCGLLTGASADLLGDLTGTVSDAVDSLRPVIDSNLKTVVEEGNNLVQEGIVKLADKVQEIQQSPVFQEVKEKLLDAQNLIQNPLSFLTANGIQPLLNEVFDLSTTVDLVGGLRTETDPQTNKLSLTLETCSSDLSNLSISVLDRKLGLLNNLLDVTSIVLKNGVSYVLQNLLCPLIQVLVNSLNLALTPDILNGSVNSPVLGSRDL